MSRLQPRLLGTGLGAGTPWGRMGPPQGHRAIAAPAPAPARTNSPDFCRKQAPNYLCRFTFNLRASAPLQPNSAAPLLEITYHATDSIPGQSGGSEDENKHKMKISSESAIVFLESKGCPLPAQLTEGCSMLPGTLRRRQIPLEVLPADSRTGSGATALSPRSRLHKRTNIYVK